MEKKAEKKEGCIIFAHLLKEHISGLEIEAGGRRGERRYKHIVFLPRGLMESLSADDRDGMGISELPIIRLIISYKNICIRGCLEISYYPRNELIMVECR